MDKLDRFQSRFVKIYGFGWWYLEIILADAGTQFTFVESKEECQTRDVHLTLAATDYQYMNRQVKVTWITLRTISHSLMVHARVLEAYNNLDLIYTANHISWYYQSKT